MKIYADGNAVDCLIDDQGMFDRFSALVDAGRLAPFITAAVLTELMRTGLKPWPEPPDEKKLQRRQRLMEMAFAVFRFEPGNLPMVAGRPSDPTARMHHRKMQVTIVGNPPAQDMLNDLRALGIKESDAIHLIEATLAKVDAFITTDKEDMLDNRVEIQARMGLEVITPRDLLERLR